MSFLFIGGKKAFRIFLLKIKINSSQGVKIAPWDQVLKLPLRANYIYYISSKILRVLMIFKNQELRKFSVRLEYLNLLGKWQWLLYTVLFYG